jgi:hypothetical protein
MDRSDLPSDFLKLSGLAMKNLQDENTLYFLAKCVGKEKGDALECL